MFAVYGVCDEPLIEDEYPGYVEWGLEFPEQSRAIAWSPGSTHFSDSAERILKSAAKLDAARLVWFL